MTASGIPDGHLRDYTALPIDSARALLSFMEMAPDVCRRHQFYRLLQNGLQSLLPHTVAICGAYDRQRKSLAFDVFNTVVLPPLAVLDMQQADAPLLRHVAQAWIRGQGEPVETVLEHDPALRSDRAVTALLDAGVGRLLVHGVSRPERRHEISSLFVLGGSCAPAAAGERRLLQIVVHGLHAAYVRTVEVEHEVGPATVPDALRDEARATAAPRVTPRELQILSWVREGKTNVEIGAELGISALTVKNHIQKLLRKLGASNRAHAMALAMDLGLLDDVRRP
jgi:transcriptional regulator EpsA